MPVKQHIDDNGLKYLSKGLQLVTQPGLRLFVIIPLLANIIIFAIGFTLIFMQLDTWLDGFLSSIPEWLGWLSWILWPLAVSFILLAFGFSFSMVGNWIAAPFNGILAEKVEQHLTGQLIEDTSIKDLIKDFPRIMLREWKKLLYWLPKALGLLILFFVPVVGQTLGPVLWFLFGAWMMAIQYIDYPFDNHKVSFHEMRDQLKQDRLRNGGFGALVMLLSTLPIINLFIMPVAVCGATAIWVDHYKQKNEASSLKPEQS